jgi:hypothetical protein
MRERLKMMIAEANVEWLNKMYDHETDKTLAEYTTDILLANGVIVPPCKVGQTVFFHTCVCDKEGEEKFDILEGELISFSLQKEGLWAYCRYKCGLTYWHLVEKDFGKTVFLTREEAEKALAERKSKDAKR